MMRCVGRWILLGCWLLCLCACSHQESSPKDVVKQLPPDLHLLGLDGRDTPISTLKGKALLINIWATWCPSCRSEMPSLEQLHRSIDKQKISIIGITVDTDKHLAREFIDQTGVTFRNFIDSQGHAANALSITAYPETLIVAPDGKIVHRVLGSRDWNTDDMRKILRELSEGK